MAIWITGGITLVGAAIGADSARKSRNAQNTATEQNGALTQQQMAEDKRRYDLDREDRNMWAAASMNGEQELYERTRADNASAMGNGVTAGNQLAYRMGLGGTGTGKAGGLNDRYKDFSFDYTKDPGYQFRMDEGQTGVNNKFASSGNLLSGAAMKALTRFNQDYASNEYGNSYGRARSGYESDRNAFSADNTNEYNRLAGIQGAGQNATNSVAGIGSSTQNQISNAYSGLAKDSASASANYGASSNNYFNNLMGNNNARANSQSAYNNAYGNQIGGGLGTIAGSWNNYQRDLKRNPGGGGKGTDFLGNWIEDNGY